MQLVRSLYLAEQVRGGRDGASRDGRRRRESRRDARARSAAAARERLRQDERWRRLRVRARQGARLLPEEGILGRRDRPRRGQARVPRASAARRAAVAGGDGQPDRAPRSTRRWRSSRSASGRRARRNASSTRASPRASWAPAPMPTSSASLRDAASKQVADDEKVLAQNAKDAAAAKDGNALVNVGYAMVSAGQFDKGIALMEQGIQKGGISRPEEARLHLAIAYLAAGQKAKAIAAFKIGARRRRHGRSRPPLVDPRAAIVRLSSASRCACFSARSRGRRCRCCTCMVG